MDSFYKEVKVKVEIVFRIVQHLWSPEKIMNPLLAEIQEDRKRIKQLLEELSLLKQWNFEYTSVLDGLTSSMNAMVWSKDEYHRYILANAVHCSTFFGLTTSSACLEEIKGKTDSELLEIYYGNHPFSNLCVLSDNYTRDIGRPCHFIEAAIVNGQELLLYIIKIPEYDDGRFIGTQGIAWDMSDVSSFIVDLLNHWIYENKAIEVHVEDNIFSYSINPEQKKCKIFRHICPDPASYIDTNFCDIPECVKRRNKNDKLGNDI